MKHLLLAMSAFALITCGQVKTDKEKLAAENRIDDTTLINNAIIDYYSKEFQKTKTAESQAQFIIDTTDEGIGLTTIIDDALYLTVSIPFSTNFIKGDLNGDKIDDLIIPVYSTSGGSASSHEIFVFTSNNGKLDFFRMYSSFELALCQNGGSHSGQFYPKKISNSILIGETYCYKSEDSHCCPSLKFTTEYKFDEGLIFLNQTKKE